MSSMDEITWTLDKNKTDAHDAFFYIEAICNAWFSFEIATRFLVSNDLKSIVRTRIAFT